MDRARLIELSRLGETHSPSLVALAEAGADTTEVAQATTSDIELDAGTVALGPSLHAKERVVPLTDWGAAQLGRRLRHLDGADAPVCYGGAGRRNAGQSSMSTMLRRLFTRAGLSAEPDLELDSVRAWAGRRAFDAKGRIEDTALHRRAASPLRLPSRPLPHLRRHVTRRTLRRVHPTRCHARRANRVV